MTVLHSLQKAVRTTLLFVPLLLLPAGVAHGQSAATAVQTLGLSAFGAATGNWTNISGGRNLGLTAGGDLSFLTFHRFRPVVEVRGTLPFYDGHIDRQKSILGGLKVERAVGKYHPYVNFLIGRGVIDFQNGGYYRDGFLYLSTVSTVYSPGLGLDLDVTKNWSAKVDFQYQHWDTPAVASGVINPRLLSIGAVYHFDFNHR